MKRIKYLIIKLSSHAIFICTILAVSQCCVGKIYQIPESKEFRDKVRNKIIKHY